MGGQTVAENRLSSIGLEAFRNRLTSIADEIGVALQRTAYSTNIKTRMYFSCAVFDHSARVVAQSFSQPVHLGSLVHFVPRILAYYGVERLAPGDGILCNDGHLGGVHLNDVCLVSPVFHEGELVAFVATLAHHLDVGGGTPGSIGLAKEIFQEGLRIPPIRFIQRGEIDESVYQLIANNIRSPKESGGDLRAQMAGVNIGCRRVSETIARYGVSGFQQLTAELFDYTETRTREEIRRIPRGKFEATGFMDNDGLTDEPIRIHVTITVTGERVSFDLTGTDPQRKCPMNATFAMTYSNCAYSLPVLLDPDLPMNDGFYRNLDVTAPPGTIVNAQSPAAISSGWETGLRVCETAMQAFFHAVPEHLAAGSKGCLCNIAFGGISPRSGKYYVFYEAMGGGYGARATKDGIDAVQAHVQNTENSPVEETEAQYPVRIVRYELIPDSEGPGRFRGGLGLRRDYCFDHDAVFTVISDRQRFAPWGLAGGGDARAARYVLNPDTSPRELSSKTTITVSANDIVSVQIGGGGGYGPAWQREPERVRQDVLAGRVSVVRAKSAYGVVIDSLSGSVDEEATREARQSMRDASYPLDPG